ncbi:MAG: hypothetical protein HYZ11_06130 [Candidatus Tectomicrobia bacterium]|uniref:Uncharacterized protein n=1 Tax=Tectimicrobiota bacterium TaxID=2528274 RepID=A0A932HXN2_UNCTE|nr:hypothetical protein [Candidatus Tectomicrobia bacterium]
MPPHRQSRSGESGPAGGLRRGFEWLKKPSLFWLRVPLGLLLTISGFAGFLPIVGFWMIPLGLSLLAVDFPPAKRLMERLNRLGGRLRGKWRR